MKKLTIIAMSLLVILGSCAKDGEDGKDGAPGTPGISGENGKDGNANVVSVTKTVSSSNWQEAGTAGEAEYQYFAEISVPEITESINETGMIMVYEQRGGGNFALPMTITDDGYSKYIDYAYGVGEVLIVVKDSDLETIPPSGDITYRIIIIEGNTVSRNADVDFTDYNEVATVFNLKEEKLSIKEWL